MPMGFTNGNAAFHRMLENLLEPVRDCADSFGNDVIFAPGDPSMSYDELLGAHERNVTRVPDLLVRHKLMGSSDKVTIAVREVVFAGHIVGNGQRKPIPGKVAAIEQCEKRVAGIPGDLRLLLGVYQDVCRLCSPHDSHAQGQPGGDQEGVKKGSGLR